MDFNSPASLGFYSSVKIAATLFCHQDLSYLAKKHLIGWVHVQDNVTQLVQSLQLPKNIEENVQELIQPVGDQIRRWLSKRAFVIRPKVDLYDKFSWTSHGTIDYKKTAENLIQGPQLSFSNKFILACVDAVKDHALHMLRNSQDMQIALPTCAADVKTTKEYGLMIHHLNEEKYKALTYLFAPISLEADFYESAVVVTASNGNTSLTRFFMTQIEPRKKAFLVKWLIVKILQTNNRFVNLDTLLFLLTQMDERGVSELIIENTEHVLLRFLEWPLQRHFMQLASQLWNAMSTATFNSVLQAIVVHIIQYCSISTNPFGYRDIFRDFWLSSPPEYRTVCMNELVIPIFSSLFRSHGYINTVLQLFQDESYLQKLEILFFSNADATLEILSNENKAKAFEHIIQRYFSPNDVPLDFGEKYSAFTQKYLEIYYGEIDIMD